MRSRYEWCSNIWKAATQSQQTHQPIFASTHPAHDSGSANRDSAYISKAISVADRPYKAVAIVKQASAAPITTNLVPSFTTITMTSQVSAPFVTQAYESRIASSPCEGNRNIYRWAVAIETMIMGVSLLACMIFLTVKSRRWEKKGATSRDPEVAELYAKLEKVQASCSFR